MMRAQTEALNLTREYVRIINTQDVFAGALVPAGLVLVASALLTWTLNRSRLHSAPSPPAPPLRDWVVAVVTACFIIALLAAVTLGYLYAVEAAAAGGVALFAFGVATHALSSKVLSKVLHEAMAITGALLALLVAATVFTLVLRGFGTDRWIAAALARLGWSHYGNF